MEYYSLDLYLHDGVGELVETAEELMISALVPSSFIPHSFGLGC